MRATVNGTEVVTHRVTSVRRHYIDVSLPRPPLGDEEAFIVRSGDAELVFRPADFAQFVRCLVEARDRVTGGHLE